LNLRGRKDQEVWRTLHNKDFHNALFIKYFLAIFANVTFSRRNVLNGVS